MRDPYDVLGVKKSASDADIKKAFRDLAKKHHPDQNRNDPKAEQKFKVVSAAYELLSDKDKRAAFDRGEIDANGQPRGFAGAGARGFEGTPEGFSFDFGFGGPQSGPAGAPGGGRFEDIFADLFSGLGGRGRAGPGRQARPPTAVSYALAVSIEDAVAGTTRRVTLEDGRTLDVKIPAGVEDGRQIRLRGQGRDGGDAIVTVSIAPHRLFKRDGKDLRLDLPISLAEAIDGARIEVPTPTGAVALNVKPGSNGGTALRLKGKGLPSAAGSGDLYVTLRLALPDSPSAELKAAARAASYDPRKGWG